MLESCASPLCVIAPGGDLVWWNPAFAQCCQGSNLSVLQIQELLLDPEIPDRLKQGLYFEKETALGSPKQRRNLILCAFPLRTHEETAPKWLLLFRDSRDGKASRAASAFSITAASHDLANPVSAIFGYADLLLDSDDSEPLSENQGEILSRIRNTAARAIELVKNYQILAQVDQHSLRLPSGTCELNKVVTDAIDNTWRANPARPELQVQLADEPLPLAVPKFAVERIFANLFTNAVKYTPEQGVVRVSTFRDGNTAVVSVHNAPTWIPETEQALIFEKFLRGSSSRDSSGSGLGLYIVKNLADRAGAAVTLESSKDAGTTFSVRFERA